MLWISFIRYASQVKENIITQKVLLWLWEGSWSVVFADCTDKQNTSRTNPPRKSIDSTASKGWYPLLLLLLCTSSTVCILCESKGLYPLWLCILFAVCAAFNHPMFDNPRALSLWHGIPCRSTCWGMDLHNTRIKRFSLLQKVQTDLWSDCKNSFHLYSMSLDSLQKITSDAE